MISEETFNGLAACDPHATGMVQSAVERRNLSQSDITRIWKTITDSVLEGNLGSRQLVQLGITLGEVSQNPEARDHYEKLFMLAAFPINPLTHVGIIGVGAAIVKIKRGEIESRALDREWYLGAAKRALIRTARALEAAIGAAASKGEDAAALEQDLVFTVEALRHVEGPEVKERLVSIVKNGFGESVVKAAGESIRPIRLKDEREGALEDLGFLLETVHPDPTTPQRMYIECIFGAVIKAYAPDTPPGEAAVAARQLATFAVMPEGMSQLFDAHTLRLIGRNVENALLHTLECGAPQPRSEAATALVRIGSDRVEGILESMERRLRGTPACGLVSDTLSEIRGAKLELIEISLAPPRPMPPLAKPRAPKLIQ